MKVKLRLFKILLVIAVILFEFLLVMLLFLPVKADTVYNGYNYYLGKYYGESRESIKELETLLLEDDYIPASYGYGNDEISSFLSDIDEFWYCQILNNPDYVVYVPKREISKYMSGTGECSTWTVNMGTVVLDYYVLNNQDDMSIAYSEDYGDNLSDEDIVGLINIKTEVPPEFETNAFKYDSDITVTLHAEEQNKDFQITVRGSNGYAFREYFVTDRYKITGAYIDNQGYGVKYNEEYTRLFEGTEINFVLTVASTEDIYEYNKSIASPNRELSMTLIKDIEEPKGRNIYAVLSVAVLSLVMIFTGIVKITLFILSNQNANEEYKDTFRFRWVLYIFFGIFIAFGYVLIFM